MTREREIAARLRMDRRTAKRLVEAAEPPRYRREPAGSMLNPLKLDRVYARWRDRGRVTRVGTRR